jgi:hypothetical protein
MWDLWWAKWHWGRFSPVSPANSHSIDCFTLIIIYHPGLVIIDQIVTNVPSGFILNPTQEIIIIIIIIQFNTYLFTCKLNSPEANYKVNNNNNKISIIPSTQVKVIIKK